MADLGEPSNVEGEGSDRVTMVWTHPLYGELRCETGVWAAIRTWSYTYTGNLRPKVPSWGGPMIGVEAEVAFPAWPAVRAWTQVAAPTVVWEGVPAELAERARGMLGVDAPTLESLRQEYVAALAAWTPYLYVWRRAMWMADEDGVHTKVYRRVFAYNDDVHSPESEDGYRGAMTVSMAVGQAEDVAVTGYLQSGARYQASWVSSPRGAHVPYKNLLPEWKRGYGYGWTSTDDVLVQIRARSAVGGVPDISDWPEYPASSDPYRRGELVGYPTSEIRAKVLAEKVEGIPTPPELKQRIAYSDADLAAHEAACQRLVEARLAEVEALVQSLVPQIREVFEADKEWVEAREGLEEALVEAEKQLKQVRGVEFPESLRVKAPTYAKAFDAETLRAETAEMQKQTSALQADVERAIAACRLPPPPVAAEVFTAAATPAAWTCHGIEEAEVSALLGVPTGVGLSGAVINGKAEPGAYPVVAVRAEHAGGKRYMVLVKEVRGLRLVVDQRQPGVSMSPYSAAHAATLIGAVTDPMWSVLIETLKDGKVVQIQQFGNPSKPKPMTPAEKADFMALARKWR